MYRPAKILLGHRCSFYRIYSNCRPYCWTSIDMPSPRGFQKEEDEVDVPILKRLNGFRDVFRHIKMYGEEFVDNLHLNYNKRHTLPEHEDVLIEYDFKKPGIFEKFLVTDDSAHKIGHSKAYLEKTKNGSALFHGTLDTVPVKDGRSARSGFASMAVRRPKYAFGRKNYALDWNYFTHLLLKIRGDGRVYAITLGCQGTYDIEMGDVFAYPLYTHGGPYWQFAMIPFSKFILTVNGRIPEGAQRPLVRWKNMMHPSNQIQSFGVTLMDRHAGPFQLEIDWVGVHYDCTTFEEWAYEKYKMAVPR